MRGFLETSVLGTDDIQPSFALVQALHPELTLERWTKFAAPLAGVDPLAERGIVGVRNERAYLCGLFVYRVESDLPHGRAFIVDVIAAIDLVDARVVIRSILHAAERMSHRLGCGIIRLRVTRSQRTLTVCVTEGGFDFEGENLVKRLT